MDLKQFKLCQIKEVAEDGTVDFILTKKVVDRDSEVILPAGAKVDDYKKNPVVLWAHDMRIPPIGKIIPETLAISDEEVSAKVQFDLQDPFSKLIHNKLKSGFLNAGSIRFRPLTWSDVPALPDQKGWTINEWELLEFSVVPVPANQAALKKMLASAGGEIEDKAFQIIKDFFTDDNFDHTPEGWVEKLNKINVVKIETPEAEVIYSPSLKNVIRSIVKEELFLADKDPVIPYEKFNLAAEETNWDEVQALKNINEWAKDDLQLYEKAFACVSDRSMKINYKYPHHDIDDGKLITVWRGVAKATVDLFEDESVARDVREYVYDHLIQHYAEFNKVAPEFGKKEEPKEEQQLIADDNMINEIARAIVALMKDKK